MPRRTYRRIEHGPRPHNYQNNFQDITMRALQQLTTDIAQLRQDVEAVWDKDTETDEVFGNRLKLCLSELKTHASKINELNQRIREGAGHKKSKRRARKTKRRMRPRK